MIERIVSAGNKNQLTALCLALMLSTNPAVKAQRQENISAIKMSVAAPTSTTYAQLWTAPPDPILQLMDKGKFQEAIHLINKDLAKPDTIKHWKDHRYAQLAQCLSKLGQTNQALQAINHVLTDSYDYYEIKVPLLIDSHRYHEAISLCNTWSYRWHHAEEPLLLESSIFLKLCNKQKAALFAVLAYNRVARFEFENQATTRSSHPIKNTRLIACSKAMVAAGLQSPSGITVTGNGDKYIWALLSRMHHIRERPPRVQIGIEKQSMVRKFFDELSADRPEVLFHLGYSEIAAGSQEVFIAIAPDLCTIRLSEVRKKIPSLIVGASIGEMLSYLTSECESLRYQNVNRVQKTIFFFEKSEPHFLRQILVHWYPGQRRTDDWPRDCMANELIAF